MPHFSLFLLALFFTDPVSTIWPGFRGDGSSHTSARSLPLRWSEKENIAWQTELPGYGQSSPVIWRDRVFLTAIQGANKEKLLTLCYDVRTGRKLWQREADATFTQEDGKTVSKAAPTPAVDSKRLYVFFESGELLAFDHRGKSLWERKLAAEYGGYKTNHGLGSSIVTTDNAVIALIAHSGESFLLAVDKLSGKNIWKTGVKSGGGWSTPLAINGGKHLIVSISGSVTAFDAGSGKLIWTVDGLKGNNIPSPSLAIEQNLISAGSSDKGMNVAIRLGGTGNITDSHIAWRAQEATANFASPLVHRGLVYFVSKVGVAYCLDAATGEEKWRQRIGGECWTSPLAAGDRIYFFTNEGSSIVVKAGDRYEELAANTLPTGRIYGVAAIDGAFLLRGGRSLIRIGSS